MSYSVLKSVQKRLKLLSTSLQVITSCHLSWARSSRKACILCLDMSCLQMFFVVGLRAAWLGCMKVMKWSLMSFIITPVTSSELFAFVNIWSISEILPLQILVALLIDCMKPCCIELSIKFIAVLLDSRFIRFMLESIKM